MARRGFAPIILLLIAGVVIVSVGVGIYLTRSGGLNMKLGKISCGETATHAGLGPENSKTGDKNKYRCIADALNSCTEANLVVNSSDWEGGNSKALYEVVADNEKGGCNLKITRESEGFYIYYGYAKTRQTCKEVSLADGYLSPQNCSEAEIVYDFCDDPNTKHKDLCKTHEAVEMKDADICEELSWDWGNQDCKVQVAIATLDPTICNEVTDTLRAGKCVADISLESDTYRCNKSANKDIEKACIRELLLFHEEETYKLKEIEAIKKEYTVSLPMPGTIEGTNINVMGLSMEGISINNRACKQGEDVFLRLGSYCTPSPVYHVTRCELTSNPSTTVYEATINYFTYTVDCQK